MNMRTRLHNHRIVSAVAGALRAAPLLSRIAILTTVAACRDGRIVAASSIGMAAARLTTLKGMVVEGTVTLWGAHVLALTYGGPRGVMALAVVAAMVPALPCQSHVRIFGSEGCISHRSSRGRGMGRHKGWQETHAKALWASTENH